MNFMTMLFLLGCLITVVSVLAVMLWSPAPCIPWPHAPQRRDWLKPSAWDAYGLACLRSLIAGKWCYLRGLARWTVAAGSAFLAARIGQGGVASWDGALLVWGVGIVFALQARSEAIRQRNAVDTGEQRRL